ncbi:hypothetical protein SAMN06265348_12025 [Pedobacter westerhofensis]|uniref:MG2 domain-containing protein n=1 Tax=Pedobacter westerhofensis TaxID=425512 RepID=A0A521FSI0_9SPHI|nr:hypothetical protein [Pedobacter westerhofensis]SMO99148.1 hypothetical protein SAMN06265348_12025 [Pedobacter westerhofensis]
MSKGIVIMLFLCSIIKIQAQSLNNALLEQKFRQYTKANPSTSLFLHIDKGIYTNNESIWFSAYLLGYPTEFKSHTLLNVLLFSNESRKIAIQHKLKIVDGLSAGSISLPDTIPPGDYQLVAYTNVLDEHGSPVVMYSTPVVVKSITEQSFSSNVQLLDTVVTNGAVRARIVLKGITAKPKLWPTVSYSVNNNFADSILLKKDTLTITIPEKDTRGQNPRLLVAIRYNKQLQHLSIALPEIEQNRIKVKFFPEGGSFPANLTSTIAWEAKTDKGLTLAMTGILLKDKQPIDTLKTNAYGVGNFKLRRDGKSDYALKIVKGTNLSKDTVFSVPRFANSSVTLHLEQAVVKDTLQATLFAKESIPVNLLLHNDHGEYVMFHTQAYVPKRILKLPLNMLPKGLTSIAIIDNNGKPLAERLFFAHYDEQLKLTTVMEKSIYKTRDSIKIKIKLADKNGKPLVGFFSAAAVQENRLNSSFEDIESYHYLSKGLGLLPKDPLGNNFRNQEYIEDILLIRSWRKYTLQHILNGYPQDTLSTNNIPIITGIVTRNNRPLKSAVTLAVFGGINSSMITTQNDGKFIVTPEQLLKKPEQKIILKVVGEKSGYKTEIKDPYAIISNTIAQRSNTDISGALAKHSNVADQSLKGLTNSIGLQTVEIRGNRRNNSVSGFKGEPGTNACGDYVDEFNYLNYPYAMRKFKPVVGKQYLIRTDLDVERNMFKVDAVYYHGCTTEENALGSAVEGIYSGQEYTRNLEFEGNLYQSTLYWQSRLETNKAGEAELVFKAGDLTGNFRLVIQGVSGDDVFFATSTFIVK